MACSRTERVCQWLEQCPPGGPGWEKYEDACIDALNPVGPASQNRLTANAVMRVAVQIVFEQFDQDASEALIPKWSFYALVS